jgi:hypothetical protein
MVMLVSVETVALGLLALLVAGLLRSHAEILRALHRLGEEVGSADGADEAPGPNRPAAGVMPPRPDSSAVFDVVGVTPFDESVSIAVGGTEVTTLLAFLSGGCSSCARFWQAFDGPDHLGLPDRTRVVIVTLGVGEESPARLRRVAPQGVPVVMSSEAWQDYAVPGAPYFILTGGREGRVLGEGSASTWAEVASLLSDAVGDGGVTPTARPIRLTGSSPETREARVDRELAAAGILPGDPRLYHEPMTGAGS